MYIFALLAYQEVVQRDGEKSLNITAIIRTGYSITNRNRSFMISSLLNAQNNHLDVALTPGFGNATVLLFFLATATYFLNSPKASDLTLSSNMTFISDKGKLTFRKD